MSRFCNPPPHRYCGAGFDRAAHRRLDADWLGARRADPHSRVLLMSGLEILFTTADQPCAEIVPVERLGQPLPEDALFLGEEDGAALFAVDLGRSGLPGCRFAEVRARLPRQHADEGALRAHPST